LELLKSPRRNQLIKDEKSGIFLFFWVCVNLFDLISCAETQAHINLGEYYLPTLVFISLLASLNYLVFDLSPGLARLAIILLCSTQLLSVLALAPDTPNHRLLAALVNLSLLVEIYKNSSLVLTSRFVETAKILTSIVYGFTFFHKLNSDYLNPATSCSTKFVDDLAQYYPTFVFLKPINDYLPILSLALEGILATIYFLPNQLVLLAVAIGFIFHSFLAIHIERHFFDFSSLMMTLLLLFIPSVKKVPVAPKLIRWFLALGFLGAYLLLLNPLSSLVSIAIIQIRTRLWIVFSIAITFYACKLAINNRGQAQPKSSNIGKLNLVILLLALLNGLTPYLGLKTRSAFDMYSNLRVEGSASNHLLVPASAQLGLLTNDLVDIVEVENGNSFLPWIRPEVLQADKRLVRFALMASMARAPGLVVKIRDERGERIIQHPEDVYLDGWVAPWIMRKLIGFRPINASSSKEFCQW